MPTAVVTGANRGIGFGLAQRLAERGFDVIGTARAGNDTSELSAVAKVVEADVTDAASLAAVAAAVDSVDVLINNAGFQSGTKQENGPLGSFDAEALMQSFRINAVGPALVTQALTSKLQPGAKVVNMTSGLGSLSETQAQMLVGYSVSKAALNMFTKQLSLDKAMRDKIVISMDPGWVKTRMGGPGGQLTVEESTNGIVEVITALEQVDSGGFFRYNGDPVEW